MEMTLFHNYQVSNTKTIKAGEEEKIAVRKSSPADSAEPFCRLFSYESFMPDVHTFQATEVGVNVAPRGVQ